MKAHPRKKMIRRVHLNETAYFNQISLLV